ncbi:MAG: C25 family cysteine peptidase, partial [Ignavibacteriaceae bacterium]|nr:C25 family cysteine peptidase [Ignavibacteriaceae bacterium]
MNSDSYFRFIPLSPFPNVSLRKKFFLVSLIFLILPFYSFPQLSRTVSFPVSSLSLTTKIAADSNTYTHVLLSNLQTSDDVGVPQLPVKYINLLIPPNSTVNNIVLSNIQTISYNIDNKIFPCQPSPITGINSKKPKFVSANKGIYDSSNIYPSKIVKVVNDSYFDCENHIVTVAVYPVQYFPKENRIELNTNITFSLQFGSKIMASSKKLLGRTQENQTIYDNVLNAMIDNPEDMSSYQTKPTIMSKESFVSKVTTGVPFYKYVIITTNALSNSFTQFVNWKKKKGIDIGVVTMENILAHYTTGDVASNIIDSAGNLRQYLTDAYYSGTVYALLADSLLPNNQHSVPIRYGCGENNTWDLQVKGDDLDHIPADLYFSSLMSNWNKDGDNFYGEESNDSVSTAPNIFVGRMYFANSTEVANWTAKEMQYEQNPFNGNYSYLTKDLWTIADEMQDDGQNTTVEAYIPSSITHTTLQEAPSADAATTTGPLGTDVINALNTGYGFYNMYNHGAQIAYVVSDSLYNLKPRRGVARYTTDGPLLSTSGYTELGSFDCINANYTSTIIYSVACDVCWPDYSQRSIGDIYTTLGNSGGPAFLGDTRAGLVYYSYFVNIAFDTALYKTTAPIYNLGQTEAVSKTKYTGTYSHYIALTHNLYGDPEMPVWTATPSTFSSLTVTDAGNTITVSTGVNGSTICVCSPDNGSSYYYSVTSSSYTFTTSVRPLYVTVTNHNYIPYCAITGGTITANTSLYGQIKLLKNLTVNSGVTLTIQPGSNLFIPNNDTIIVNGTLTVAGTSANPVTFNLSGTGTWGTIAFNGSGSSGSSLNYVTINNGAGIRCLNGANPTIQNSTIQNCTQGVYVYNSSPSILSNQILNPT